MEDLIVVGTKITLAKGSRYYKPYSHPLSDNPSGIIGAVVNVKNIAGRMAYKVLWSNGLTNSYRDGDLKVLGQGVCFGHIIKKGKLNSLTHYGEIGEKTPLVGTDGKPLYVGDVVSICYKDMKPEIWPVVKRGDRFFVMGFACATENGVTWSDVSYKKRGSFYKNPTYPSNFSVVKSLEDLDIRY